uniref:Uncharacterized protein n=1 Tax=Romanomermis culicivorax TaxID=13658 RepID=A0A915JTC5_ROMCU
MNGEGIWTSIRNSKCEGVERNGLIACGGCSKKIPDPDDNRKKKTLCFCQFGSNCNFGHPKTCTFLKAC